VEGSHLVNHFSQVIADGEFVTMADPVLGDIVRVPRCDKTAEILWSAESPREIDVAGSEIFWIAQPVSDAVARLRGGAPGDAPFDLYVSTESETLYDLAVDATHVYFVANDGASARLLRVARSGGAIEEVSTLPASPVGRLALSPTQVYVHNGWSVTQTPKAGGQNVTFATVTAAFSRHPIDVDGGIVYWADGSDLFSAPEIGGPATLIASLPTLPDFFLAESGYITYSSVVGSVIARVAVAGDAAPEILFEGPQTGGQSFALDEQAFYWVDLAKSSLDRMAKPAPKP